MNTFSILKKSSWFLWNSRLITPRKKNYFFLSTSFSFYQFLLYFRGRRHLFNGVLFSKETFNEIILLCLDYYVLIMMLRLWWKNLKAGKISDIKVKRRAFCCFFLVQTFKVVFANKTVNFSKHYLLEGFIKFFLNVCIQIPVMKNDRYIQIYKYLYNFISSEAYPFTAYAGITHRTFSEN